MTTKENQWKKKQHERNTNNDLDNMGAMGDGVRTQILKEFKDFL